MIFKSAPWRGKFQGFFLFMIEFRFLYLRIVYATTTQKPKLVLLLVMPGAFQISQDLQTLMWRECEGNGSSKRLPLSSIASVKEISVPKNGSGNLGAWG